MRKQTIICLTIGAVALCLCAQSSVIIPQPPPKETFPIEVSVRVETKVVLPWESVVAVAIYKNTSDKDILLEKASCECDTRAVDGTRPRPAYRGANCGLGTTRPVLVTAGGSVMRKHTIVSGGNTKIWSAGKYQIKFDELGIGQRIDGVRGWLKIETDDMEFEIVEPSGIDKEVWEMIGWGKKYEGADEYKAVRHRVVEEYPQSRYAPYILFYDIRNYATFIERYPEHPLAPKAYLEWAQFLVGALRLFGMAERGETTVEKLWSSEQAQKYIQGMKTRAEVSERIKAMMNAVKETHPESDGAWLAEYVLKLVDLRMEYYRIMSAKEALTGLAERAEALAMEAPSGWVREQAEILEKDVARGLPNAKGKQ